MKLALQLILVICSSFFSEKNVEELPDEKWTIFPGDLVQVMVGKDKGKQGFVQKVLRESNSVYVEGLHRVSCFDLFLIGTFCLVFILSFAAVYFRLCQKM